jgi:hypothetical protein
MAIDIQNLDCVDERSGNTYKFDVSNPETFGHVFSLALPDGMQGHTLVESMGIHRGGVTPDNSIEQEILTVSFFLATSGRYDLITGDGPYWRLHEQQLDFLISYLEQLDAGTVTRPLAINFCDESPQLEEIIEQIHSCMQLFNTPTDKVFLCGMNFDGQQTCNKYAKKENVDPLKYVPFYNMHGHMRWQHLENILDRVEHTIYYNNDCDDWNTIKGNTFTFLNRRFAYVRALALWALYIEGSWKYKSIVSAFPPLFYFKIGAESKNASEFCTLELMDSLTKKHTPLYKNQLHETSFKDFANKYRLGQSLEGDAPYIGGEESKWAPNMTDSYLWYTVESVADHKETNTFFTEKTLKPMMYGQGLILLSQPGMISKFKQLGFHTLAEELGFSEEYDNEEDLGTRMQMISQEIVKLCEVPLSVMHERWLTAKPKIIENKKRVACMLTNIPDNYWKNVVRYCDDSIREQYDSKSLFDVKTSDILKDYQNLFNIDEIHDK